MGGGSSSYCHYHCFASSSAVTTGRLSKTAGSADVPAAAAGRQHQLETVADTGRSFQLSKDKLQRIKTIHSSIV
jgi:hypothetical protein